MTEILSREERLNREYEKLAKKIANEIERDFDVGHWERQCHSLQEDFHSVYSDEISPIVLDCIKRFFKDNYGVQDS